MRIRAALLVSALAAGLLSVLGVAAPAQAGTISQCQSNPNPPDWFITREQQAADVSGDSVPSSWGTSLNIKRIFCRESDFRPTATNGQYYGLGQMSPASVSPTGVSWDHYVNGSSTHPATFYQTLAAMRYCKSRYGDTTTAWQHEVNSGWW